MIPIPFALLVEKRGKFLKQTLSLLLLLHLLLVDKVVLATNEPPGSILKGNAREGQLLLKDERLATVGADNDLSSAMR